MISYDQQTHSNSFWFKSLPYACNPSIHLYAHKLTTGNKPKFNSLYLSSITYTQVSTATGTISHLVNLQVVVPEAFILGSGELHVDMGSTINLVCIIEKVRKHLSFVMASYLSFMFQQWDNAYTFGTRIVFSSHIHVSILLSPTRSASHTH